MLSRTDSRKTARVCSAVFWGLRSVECGRRCSGAGGCEARAGEPKEKEVKWWREAIDEREAFSFSALFNGAAASRFLSVSLQPTARGIKRTPIPFRDRVHGGSVRSVRIVLGGAGRSERKGRGDFPFWPTGVPWGVLTCVKKMDSGALIWRVASFSSYPDLHKYKRSTSAFSRGCFFVPQVMDDVGNHVGFASRRDHRSAVRRLRAPHTITIT